MPVCTCFGTATSVELNHIWSKYLAPCFNLIKQVSIICMCDPIWHVSSRSGVATLRTATHLLLTAHCYATELSRSSDSPDCSAAVCVPHAHPTTQPPTSSRAVDGASSLAGARRPLVAMTTQSPVPGWWRIAADQRDVVAAAAVTYPAASRCVQLPAAHRCPPINQQLPSQSYVRVKDRFFSTAV